MEKKMTELKCVVNGKDITFSCESECNTFEAKEALCLFIKYVCQVEESYQAKLKAEQDSKVEELKVEEIG